MPTVHHHHTVKARYPIHRMANLNTAKNAVIEEIIAVTIFQIFMIKFPDRYIYSSEA